MNKKNKMIIKLINIMIIHWWNGNEQIKKKFLIKYTI